MLEVSPMVEGRSVACVFAMVSGEGIEPSTT